MNAILIVMAFAFAGGVNGGARSTLMQIPMPSMSVCEAAAAKIARDGPAATNRVGNDIGTRRVEAVCVSAVP